MIKYPYFVYEVEEDLFVTKLIHFIPEGEVKPKGGITVTCRESPFDEKGEVDLEARMLLRKAGWRERKRTGMPVCVVFATDDCDYIGPDGNVRRSANPPKLGENLLTSSPIVDEHPTSGGPIDLMPAVKNRKAIIH